MKEFPRVFSKWLLIAAVLVTWHASSARAATNYLRPTALVDSVGVYLHQLIQSDEALPKELKLADAPSPGRTVELSRTQIAEAALKLDTNLCLTNWAGAEKIKISRKMRLLEESELHQMLLATLQREKVRSRGELELKLGRPWAAASVPDEPLSLKLVELPVAGVTPSFIVRFELCDEKETLGTWQMPVQARIWCDVWVARSGVMRGQLLRDADLTTERRDVLTSRDALTVIDFKDPTLEMNENLASGMPVLARSIRQRPLIFRGRLIEAIVQDGPLVITLKAEAMEDGLRGQVIRVRNAVSKREFRGKVQNEQTVIVTL